MKRTLNYIIFDRLLLFIVGKKFNMLLAIGLNLKLFTGVDEKLQCPEFGEFSTLMFIGLRG